MDLLIILTWFLGVLAVAFGLSWVIGFLISRFIDWHRSRRYIGQKFIIINGANKIETTITKYHGRKKVITVTPIITSPDSSSEYLIVADDFKIEACTVLAEQPTNPPKKR